MLNYDFLTLSPNEFENISRDLLQKKLNIFIESFTTGRDGGIDFRHTTNTSKTHIIQSKRFKEYTSLYSHLKKEVTKVKKLNPDKYILTTSVGLTPPNKAEILALFSPFIKQTEDILGKDDLNNLLGLYKEIEKKYYKLWLTSITILEKILHSKIYNQSAFELEEIKEQVKLYVQNDSFNEALSILKEHHYVIISGIPGIGKTTLSRILILYLLSAEFEEFIYLSDSIDEGYQFFDDNKKQVFFFDDFLGKIRFEARNLINVDTKITKFIEKIKKTADKVLIIGTREYILSQARNTFEAFRINNIEIAKCILDLSSFTKIIKAQIIYNHLFFANVPQSHLTNLVENGNYLKLVNHKNYSPRILEAFINLKIWEHCAPHEFTSAFKSYFDNPDSVWQNSFENSLDKFSQYTLLVMLSIGTPVLINDLELAIQEFLVKNNYKYFIGFDSITFNRAIRELENTFIKTQKDSYNEIVIEYQNPSIQDFLLYYLKDKKDLINSLIESSLFAEQFFNIFIAYHKINIVGTNDITFFEINKLIELTDDQIQISINRIKTIYPEIKTARVIKLNQGNSEKFMWYRYSSFIYSFIRKVNKEFSSINQDAKEFVHDKFQDIILLNDSSYSEQSSYIELLSTLNLTTLSFNEEELIDNFVVNIKRVDNFNIFTKIKNIFPGTYKDITSGSSFPSKVTELIQDEIASVKDSDIHELIGKIESVESEFLLDYKDEINNLKKKESAYEDHLESQAESYINDNKDSDGSKGLGEKEETEIIHQIFNSLLSE